MEDGYDYFGNDAKSGQDSDGMKDCAEKCLAEPTCQFWSMEKSTGRCYLKTSKAGKKTMNGLLSGNQDCGEEGEIGESSIEDKRLLNGYLITQQFK